MLSNCNQLKIKRIFFGRNMAVLTTKYKCIDVNTRRDHGTSKNIKWSRHLNLFVSLKNTQFKLIKLTLLLYRSWNKPKTTDLKPDMNLKSRDVSLSGSGICRHYEYSFRTGKFEFLLDNNKTCVECKPPANITGNLSVLVDGELKNHYYCFKP